MVYSLVCARDHFPDDRYLLISYGDIVYDASVVESLRLCDASVCVVIDRLWRKLWERRFDDPLDDAETLTLKDGQITAIGEPAESFDDVDAHYIGLVQLRSDHRSHVTPIEDERSGGGTGLDRKGFI